MIKKKSKMSKKVASMALAVTLLMSSVVLVMENPMEVKASEKPEITITIDKEDGVYMVGDTYMATATAALNAEGESISLHEHRDDITWKVDGNDAVIVNDTKNDDDVSKQTGKALEVGNAVLVFTWNYNAGGDEPENSPIIKSVKFTVIPASTTELEATIIEAKALREGVEIAESASEVEKGKQFVTSEANKNLDMGIKQAEEKVKECNETTKSSEIADVNTVLEVSMVTYSKAKLDGTKPKPSEPSEPSKPKPSKPSEPSKPTPKPYAPPKERPASTPSLGTATIGVAGMRKMIEMPVEARHVLPISKRVMVDDLVNIMFAKPGLTLDTNVLEAVKMSGEDFAIMFDDYAITLMPDQFLEPKALNVTMDIVASADGTRVLPQAQGAFGTNVIVTVKMPEDQRENVFLYVENADGTVNKFSDEIIVDEYGYVRFPMMQGANYLLTNKPVANVVIPSV